MKESNDAKEQAPGSVDEFEKRAQSILEQLDRADRILDGLQDKDKRKKPEKAADTFDEVLESLEQGIRKLVNAVSSQFAKPTDRQNIQPFPTPEKLVRYLRSCSDEQLAAIRSKIDNILKERGAI
jgi:predicted  nucleic acid-binding Zn-ribbon protein